VGGCLFICLSHFGLGLFIPFVSFCYRCHPFLPLVVGTPCISRSLFVCWVPPAFSFSSRTLLSSCLSPFLLGRQPSFSLSIDVMFLLSTGCLIESACFLYKGFFLPPGVVFFLFQSLCCLPFAMLYLSLWWWVTKVFSARQNVVVVLHCGDSSYPRLFPASSCFSAALSSLVFVPPRFFSFSPLWWGVICKPLVVSPVYILLLLH